MKEIDKLKPFVLSIGFVLFLLLFETYLFQRGYIKYFDKIFTGDFGHNDEYYRFLITRSVTILTGLHLFIFIFASAISKPMVKLIYWLVFTIAISLEYGYMVGLGRFSNPSSIYLALLFNDIELWSDAVLAYFNFFSIIPIIVYASFLYKTSVSDSRGFKFFSLIIIFTIGFYSVLFQFFIHHGGYTTISVGNFLQTSVFLPWYHDKFNSTDNTPRDVITYKSNRSPNNNIIFVIDESVRGDHFSVNGYNRPTTPYLESLAEQRYLYSWGISVSGATCSLEANKLLFTGATPDELNQVDSMSSIFQYSQAMGYKTYSFDGTDTIELWFGKPYDTNYTDEWRSASLFEKSEVYDIDLVIAQEINRIINNSVGNFIWFNKRGIHFNYRRYYPETETIWKPDLSIYTSEDIFGINPNKREQLVNSYDNAIRYNVDNFFRQLTKPTLPENTTIIYTSDHGQTLSEYGEHWTHCRDTKNEAIVPLLMVTTKAYEIDTTYKASHANIFPTLLDLMSFPQIERSHNYAPSLLTATSSDIQNRYYYAHSSEQILKFD